MMTQTSLIPVTRELVPEDRRLAITETLFGMAFPLRLEPVIYGITDRMAEDYKGGYWEFYTLSNGGFYMAPAVDRCFHVTCDNQFEGDLSSDALGITSCLYAYSNLSFASSNFARECARHYHLLREYMMEHPEVRAILGATD
ncbi:MAG: antirestriction protein [Pseudomonadota bacterium]